MIKKCLRSVKGFTLVELVMVMVIIGLLAAIIVPKFTSQKDQAGIAATKANLENLRTAIALYYAQEEDWPSADLTELTQGGKITGAVYMRGIPSTRTYDPDGAPVLPNNAVKNASGPSTPYGGWYWDYSNQNYTLLPNLAGNDANNQLFNTY